MYNQFRGGPARLNSYHGPKRQLLGNPAGHVPPAWRNANVPAGLPHNANVASGSGPKKVVEAGSKILLSNLPMDVGENEVEELFKRTVGPMKDLFIIYNSQGRSKGMAVVTFQRPGDAVVARTKYNQKIVDGKHRIKIEIVTDTDDPKLQAAPTPAPAPPTLLQRIGHAPTTAQNGTKVVPLRVGPPVVPTPTQPKIHVAPRPVPRPAATVAQIPAGPRRRRQKKGAKRVMKKPATAADLDQEMEDYRAKAAA